MRDKTQVTKAIDELGVNKPELGRKADNTTLSRRIVNRALSHATRELIGRKARVSK